jgi:CBS domain containing-hemolysin-like protein
MVEVEGRMDLDDFNQMFKTSLKSEEFQTIAGYLLEKIKRIPLTGEIFILENLQFKITRSLPSRIEKIFITRLGRPSPASSQNKLIKNSFFDPDKKNRRK